MTLVEPGFDERIAELGREPRRGRRPVAGVLAVAAAAIAVIGLLAAIVRGPGDDEPGIGGARVELDGTAQVLRGGSDPQPLADGDVVYAGDEVVAMTGAVTLRLTGGATLEGRGPQGDIDGTRVVLGEVPSLEAGDLLAVAQSGLAIDAGGNVVSLAPRSASDAAMRVRRSLSVTIAAFTGTVGVDSAGQSRAVPALRQISIATLGRPPAAAIPLRIDDGDPWDRRFLGDAIDLTRRLDAISRSSTANLTGRELSAPALEAVLPGLSEEPDFGADLLEPGREPGETMIGAAIALLGREGSFAERWQAAFEFRDAGAVWGLVALDQDVNGEPLIALVEGAASTITAPGGPFAQPVIRPTPVTSPTGSTITTAPGPTTTDTTAPPPTTTPPTTPPDPGVVPPTGIPLLDGVVDPVDELLGGLLNP